MNGGNVNLYLLWLIPYFPPEGIFICMLTWWLFPGYEHTMIS